MIRVYGLGRLTNVPDIKYNQEGKVSVASFSIATSRWSAGGEKTDFFRCVAFGHNAEFAEKYLNKGNKVFIDGYMQTSKYTDKNGQERTSIDLVIDRFEFCEPKSEKAAADRAEAVAVDDQVELPFK